MIIEAVMEVIFGVLDKMLVLSIPDLPPEVLDYVDTMFTYMETGASILANYTPLPYLLTLFGVLVAVDAGILIYHFVMWVIKKIPFLGME